MANVYSVFLYFFYRLQRCHKFIIFLIVTCSVGYYKTVIHYAYNKIYNIIYSTHNITLQSTCTLYSLVWNIHILFSLTCLSGKDKGEIELSEATDVYALGTVWYEILAGHWPWPGHSPEQVSQLHFQTRRRSGTNP